MQRYRSRFGPHAPVLNSIGQSCYEGLMFLHRIVSAAGSMDIGKLCRIADGLEMTGPRGRMRMVGRHFVQGHASRPRPKASNSPSGNPFRRSTRTEGSQREPANGVDRIGGAARDRCGTHFRPREYAEALLAQCEAANGLNAFIHLDPQQVLDAAGRAAPGSGGRLSGLPVPVKDNFDTDNMPTTGGTPGLPDHRPARNAPVVQRLIDEGAIVMGKLNMHELAYGITSNNSAIRARSQPLRSLADSGRQQRRLRRRRRGQDGAGRAGLGHRRLGAHPGCPVRRGRACGPSTGRYSQAGIVPISNTRDTAGLLARSVEDLALFDSVIVGAAGDLPAMSLKGARIGVPRGHYFENLHPETARVAEEALAALAAAGAVLVEADMPEVPKLDEAAGFPIALYETVVELTRYLSEHRPADRSSPPLRACRREPGRRGPAAKPADGRRRDPGAGLPGGADADAPGASGRLCRLFHLERRPRGDLPDDAAARRADRR